MDKKSQCVSSKWRKTEVLMKSSELQKYIPETQKWSAQTLRKMTDRHNMVYLKPDRGSCGVGVMKVLKLAGLKKDTSYSYQAVNRIRRFQTLEDLAAALDKRIGEKQYLIQKGIRLLKFENRNADIRVMVQKNPEGRWETTGILARMGPPGSAVTNISGGGEILPVAKLLASNNRGKTVIDKLSRLGLKVATHLEQTFPRMKEIGIDVAIDRGMKLWILEVNTKPDPRLFNRLDNKKTIRRIVRYAKAYGRSMNLTPSAKRKTPIP